MALLAAALLAGCALVPPASPALDVAELAPLDLRLGLGLSAVLQLDDPAAEAVVLLPFSQTPPAADGGPEPDLLALHQLFVLADAPDPLSPTASVLRAYGAILRAASCVSPPTAPSASCRLLEDARRLFDTTPDEAPPFNLPGFPAWKAVSATPRNWAAADAPWTAITLNVGGYRVEMEQLSITLHRPWLSEEFLAAGGWYIAGACRAAVSAGPAGGEAEGRALLPRLPVGLLIAREFRLMSAEAQGGKTLIEWHSPRVLAWLQHRLPLAPLVSDPCRADCPDARPAAKACDVAP